MYSYDRRKTADSEDLRPLLTKFQHAIANSKKRWAEIEEKPDALNVYRAAALVPSLFDVLRRVGADSLFWGIIQQYKMSSTDQKLVEKAAKEFAKAKRQSPKLEVAVETLKKQIETYEQYSEVAQRVLNKGGLHIEETSGTTQSAGCFTLVNAGGFSDQQMADVKKVVEEATRKLKAKGLGRVCYGTMQVTNTISRANVLAFYLIARDEMFIRGNLRGKQGPAISTILHELGHRLQHKFLKSKDAEIKAIYKTLTRQQEADNYALEQDRTKWPQPGDPHTGQKGIEFIVDKVSVNNRAQYVVNLHMKEDPKMKATLPLSGWFSTKGLKRQTFVTNYARTDPDENLAEMIAHYCLGTLPDGQIQMLEAIL